MGVSHLQKYADMANGAASAPTRPKNSQNTTRSGYGNPKQTAVNVTPPDDGSDGHYADQAARPGNAPAHPPFTGGPAGARQSGLPKVGTNQGTKHPLSGGEAY